MAAPSTRKLLSKSKINAPPVGLTPLSRIGELRVGRRSAKEANPALVFSVLLLTAPEGIGAKLPKRLLLSTIAVPEAIDRSTPVPVPLFHRTLLLNQNRSLACPAICMPPGPPPAPNCGLLAMLLLLT